jgi:signal transduction histidine kinase
MNAERLDRLADQLRELSRLDAHQTTPVREVFAIEERVHDVAIKFRPQAEASNVDLSVDAPPSLPRVDADIGLIERLISNLVDNALRNTPAGGRARLYLTSENGRVRVNITDTGPGIPKEEIPPIRQRFYQVDSTTGEREGSGLGLSIAAEIADLHGSELTFDSAVGQGTTVSFALPTVDRSSA